jgi:hypothetical protein
VPTLVTANGPMLVIDPDQNILMGARSIMHYMRIKSWVTLYRWIELYGFPAIKNPEGHWMSSMTAIDQWIFISAEADWERRVYSRGGNRRTEKLIRMMMDRQSQPHSERMAGSHPNRDGALRLLESELATRTTIDITAEEAQESPRQEPPSA